MRTKNPGEYLVFNEVAPVDDSETFTESYQRLPCQHNHASAVCRCQIPLCHIGQDESVYHAHSIHGAWTRCGHSKNNEGNVNRLCVTAPNILSALILYTECSYIIY